MSHFFFRSFPRSRDPGRGRRLRRVAAGLAVATLTACGPSGQLEVAEPVRRPIGGQEEHRYEIEVPEARFLRIAVEQRGSNVTVALRSLGGDPIAESDVLGIGRGTESIVAELVESGIYQVLVRSPSGPPAAEAGNYQLELEIFRPRSEQDQRVRRADTAYKAALEAPDGTRKGLERSVELYDQALAAWEELGDEKWLARGAGWRALVSINLGRIDEAEAGFERAVEHGERAEAIHAAAFGHQGLGSVWEVRGQVEEAEAHYKAALEMFRSLRDPFGEADTLDTYAVLLSDQARYDEARAAHEGALALWRRLEIEAKIGKSLTGLGLLAEERGEIDQAFEFHREALRLRREAEDRTGVAAVLNNLGRAHFSIGEHQAALDHWFEAAGEMEAAGRIEYRGTILGNIGAAYRRLGEPQRALATYSEALAIAEQVGDARGSIRLRNNVAKVRKDLEDFESAGTAFREVAGEAASLGYQDLQAAALLNLGDSLLERTRQAPAGERSRAARDARALFETAESLFSERDVIAEVGGCLLGIARSYHRLGETEKAVLHAEKALAAARRARDRVREQEILALLGALVARRDLDQAIAHYEASLAIVERQRRALASRDLRSAFFSRRRQPYVDTALLYLEKHAREPDQGYDERSFLLSERAKARTLVDYLQAADVESKRSEASRVLERYRATEKLLALRERQWQRRLTSGDASALEAAKRAAEEVRRELDQLAGKLALADPRLAVVTGRKTATLAEIRRRFATPGSILVAYLLGESESLVYAVTDDDLIVRHLPAKHAIEVEARRFVTALAAGDLGAGESLAERAAERLGTLLLEPVAGALAGARTVHVAGDGVLHGVPFSALRIASKSLVETHEIVQLPSASAALLLTGTAEPRGSGTALLVGDVSYPEGPETEGAVPASTSARAAPALLQPLRHSVAEIAAVEALWPGEAVVLKGREASVEGVLAQPLDRFGLLHFAVHAVLDVRRPGASGLVLSPPTGQEGAILGPRDLYQLRLHADLVTLSACRSALGRPIEGEGFIGLSTAFLYAGARNVVATLWSVDDEATAVFMKAFYSGLVGGGLSPSSALRRAQLSLAASPGYRAPYYWAPFVLIGPG